MSNCIEIERYHEVIFTEREIDIPLLKIWLGNGKELKNYKDPTEEQLTESLIWWFLQKNTDVLNHTILIRFGQGRSGHTNRDFKNTLMFLKDFMFKNKVHTFHMTDEYDGFQKVFRWTVNFNDPEASWKPAEEAYAKKMAGVKFTVTPFVPK